MLFAPLLAVPDILAYATEELVFPVEIVGVLFHVLNVAGEKDPLADVVEHEPEEYIKRPVILIWKIFLPTLL